MYPIHSYTVPLDANGRVEINPCAVGAFILCEMDNVFTDGRFALSASRLLQSSPQESFIASRLPRLTTAVAMSRLPQSLAELTAGLTILGR